MPQSIFPLTPVKIASGAVNYDWADIDLSAYLPAGATGAIVWLRNTDPGVRPWGVRENGSTDARVGDMSGNDHCWGMVGVDSSRKIEFRNTHLLPSKVEMYLVGYTMVGVTFQTNGTLISGGLVAAAWTDIDLSSLIPSNAIGVIVEVDVTAPPRNYGLRENGSSDNRIDQAGNRKNQFTAVIGCDAAQVIEGYRDAAGANFYLLGYITEGAIFNLNAVNWTPAAINVYERLPGLPSGALMAFIEVANAGGTDYGFRPAAGTSLGQHGASSHPWAIQACDGDGRVDGYRDNAGFTFWLTGYARYGLPVAETVAATEIIGGAVTLNGAITDDGGEACEIRFQYGTTIALGTYSSWKGAHETGATFSEALTNLIANTTYYFQAEARNSSGEGTVGAMLHFTTKGGQTKLSLSIGSGEVLVGPILWTQNEPG